MTTQFIWMRVCALIIDESELSGKINSPFSRNSVDELDLSGNSKLCILRKNAMNAIYPEAAAAIRSPPSWHRAIVAERAINAPKTL